MFEALFRKKHIYFVSYSYSSNATHGVGNCSICLLYPVKTMEDIRIMRDFIKKLDTTLDHVVITHYQLLRVKRVGAWSKTGE